MASDQSPNAMSIVPYATNREIVLRHNDQVVVYDPRSKQLALRNTSTHTDLDLTECPYCHRPFRDDERPRSQGQSHGGSSNDPASFVSPEYFRMLHQSLPDSEIHGPPSPRRRLVQPTRSRQTSGSVNTPEPGYSDIPIEPPSPSGISSSALSPGYFERFFVQEGELGRGGKGVVLLVRHMLDGVDLGLFACKRVPVGDDHEWLRKVLVEVQLLQYLSHQHLVSYRHVWLEDVKLSNFGPSVPCAFILQQFCNAGDLQKYVSRSSSSSSDPPQSLKDRVRRRSRVPATPSPDLRGRDLRFEEIYSFFKDITSGLNHLHVNGYIHRDLKPSNCLLHNTGHGYRVLVSDFGEVQIENMVRKSTGATGTISYCAPEVLQREPSGRYANFTPKSDIFSLGMILYFLCFKRLPYPNANALDEDMDEDLDQLRDEITSWAGLQEERKLRPDLPEKLYTFLRRLLSLDPNDRPTTDDILLGIKTGSGLDEVIDSRHSSSSTHKYDDLRNSSRISPVDSPVSRARSPMPPSPPRRMSTSLARTNTSALSKLRFGSSPQQGTSSTVDETPPTSPGGSLVLREKFPSPSPTPSDQLVAQAQLPEPPSLMGPPTPESGRSTQLSIKLILFILKVVSANLLCSPVAVDPKAAYPLLGLAMADFLLQDARMVGTVALVVVHVGLLWGFRSWGVLCVPAGRVFECFT